MRTVVRAARRTGRVFDVVTPSRATFAVEAGAYDRPGAAAGPAPMELLLAALITCAGSTVDDILTKMRHPATALNVVADAQRAETTPRVYTDILVEFQLAADAPSERLLHAIRLAERTCSASVMLASSATLTTRLVEIRRVEAEVTRPLRQRVLRPHQTLEELVDPGETSEESVWFAAIQDGTVVGTAGLIPEPSPDGDPAERALRLRAMAVSEEVRGRGVGTILMRVALSHAWNTGADMVWCSARTPSAGFCAAEGFVPTSDVYDVAHIGPHLRMALHRT